MCRWCVANIVQLNTLKGRCGERVYPKSMRENEERVGWRRLWMVSWRAWVEGSFGGIGSSVGGWSGWEAGVAWG